MRKLAGTLLAVAIAVVGVIGLIAFFNSRDNSTTSDQRPAATTPASRSESTALLRAGNIVVRYRDPADAAPLKRLASDLGAPDTPELRRAGQAVVLRRDTGATGVVAEAYRPVKSFATPQDPGLRAFIEEW